jgi:alcohol dehydrogenase (cytochrome c)
MTDYVLNSLTDTGSRPAGEVLYSGVTNRRASTALPVCALVLLGCGVVSAGQQTTNADEDATPALLRNLAPVTDAMLRQPDAEDWISFRNGYPLWGYSALDQLDTANVGELRLVWSRAMQRGYQEVEPIVYDGVMFLANVEDIVQALDATTGDLLWEYRRNLPDNIANVTGTRYRYRNVSIYDDKIFLATNDAFLVALDVRTGELVWETERADYRERVAQTAGPIVVKGKLITGSRCNPSSPRPGGCFITAHDVRSGDELWRINTAATPDQVGGDTWGGLPVSARRHASR